jgi:predicted AlkP superfamily pyrophosphatase or phosphodiesterase
VWTPQVRACHVVVAAGVLAAATGCSARYVRSATPPPVNSIPSASVSRHVVVVSIDGLRPDAITTFRAPTLQRLMREGSYTLSGRTIDPSKTLPSHTSMLTGQPPERHGVLWNNVATADAESIEVPNVFGLDRERG